MTQVFRLPYEFVNLLRETGLPCGVGNAKLNAYLSSSASNGGADSAASLIGNIRSKLKDGGTGPTLQSLHGSALDRMVRGCGSPAVISDVWKFLCRNKEALKEVKVTAYDRRDKKAQDDKVKKYTGNVYDLYFAGRSDAEAIQKMVDDRFFGMDCIGFLGNYLVWVGEWSDYQGLTPSLWPERLFKEPVKKASDVRPLDLLCWNGHVAIVDYVWDMIDEKTVEVDICQSSEGGPQCNTSVHLKEFQVSKHGPFKFTIPNRGSPQMPVFSTCIIQRRTGFFW